MRPLLAGSRGRDEIAVLDKVRFICRYPKSRPTSAFAQHILGIPEASRRQAQRWHNMLAEMGPPQHSRHNAQHPPQRRPATNR